MDPHRRIHYIICIEDDVRLYWDSLNGRMVSIPRARGSSTTWENKCALSVIEQVFSLELTQNLTECVMKLSKPIRSWTQVLDYNSCSPSLLLWKYRAQKKIPNPVVNSLLILL